MTKSKLKNVVQLIFKNINETYNKKTQLRRVNNVRRGTIIYNKRFLRITHFLHANTVSLNVLYILP